ncbi:hypothetical protein ACFWVC_31790 [Streptomyces sp. NPDC058691]|uniref:hypothetical protein n=1 Tax=Streptomyces sp. NPDC058691 TaxID=3346601 RepID=UPI00365015C8
MATRPSEHWRAGVAEEARKLRAGAIDPESAYMSRLFPESLSAATDRVLSSFEAEMTALRNPSDAEVFAAVERAVLALNSVNEEHGGGGCETGEREELCAYLDLTLVEHGIDVPALAARNGIGRYEITDRWREW